MASVEDEFAVLVLICGILPHGLSIDFGDHRVFFCSCPLCFPLIFFGLLQRAVFGRQHAAFVTRIDHRTSAIVLFPSFFDLPRMLITDSTASLLSFF